MSEFQPPEFDPPEMDDDDRMRGALSDLAGIDTYDVDLRDHPKAYEVLDRLMTHAYAEGRRDERAGFAGLMAAVEQILDVGHMNQEDLARLRAAWSAA